MFRRVVTYAAAAGLVAATVAFIPSVTQAQDELPWMDTSLTPEKRADLLIGAMTLDQKLQQIYNQPFYNQDLDPDGDPEDSPADRNDCNFTIVGRHIEGIPSLKIPTFRQANGGTGIRGGDCLPEPVATALPAQVSSAATFNRDLMTDWGKVLDVELEAWADQVLWGPGMNMIRTPYGGRNNEYFSEDPYLTGVMASQIIKGIQARGVSQATAKHFVANDSEYQFERWTSANRVPSRALHEIYLLPFEMAVKDADVASVMCAYPDLNYTYNCSSSPLLQQTLRQRWGFDGYVFSDRRAQQSTLDALRAGVDVELDESPEWYKPEILKQYINSGVITEEDIDALLRPRYIKMFEFGNFEHPLTSFQWDKIDPLIAKTGSHAQIAKQAGAEGLVLLRNDKKILPLNAGAVESIAVIGPQWFASEASLPPRSGNRAANITVNEPFQVTPVQGLRNVLQNKGSDATVTLNNGTNIASAERAARNSDITILMVGDVARETWDKNAYWPEENPNSTAAGAPNETPNLDLPTITGTNQQELIPRVLAANPNTIVVMKTQGQVNMPWIDDVHTMVQAWYPGEWDGDVVAEALFGDSNFSGKLPLTIGRTDSEAAYATTEQYNGYEENTGTPGGYGRDPQCIDPAEQPPCTVSGPKPQRVVRYTEGLKMGYRWYQATKTEPYFPFGFGLSYTTFDYSDLSVREVGGGNGHTAVRADFTVTNTGKRDGKEVPQVYLTLPKQAGEPSKRLVGFDKIDLAAGQSKRVSVLIDSNASNHPFSYFVPDDADDLRKWADGDWATADGDYTVHVGRSSADTPLERTVNLNFSNRRPTAENVTGVRVREGRSVVINLKASDPDGDALSYTYSDLKGNTVTPIGNGSAVRFTPKPGFTGRTSFRYTVNDGHGGEASAEVFVTVTPAPKTNSRITNVKVKPNRLTTSTRARVSFRVRSGGKAARGNYVIRARGEVVGRGTLNARGRANERIKRLGAGRQKLRIVYQGSATAKRAVKVRTVRVFRR